MRLKTFIIIFIISISGCNLKSDKKQQKTFYNNISGWDISYIPIIKPYRATTIDKRKTWQLGIDELKSISILSFGVSQGFIYGHKQENWFLFDTKSKLLATYQTRKELIKSLISFKIPIKTIADCNLYHDSLIKGKSCYWFPKDGQNYQDYSSFIVNETIPIKVIENLNEQPDFKFNQTLKSNDTKIYFFRISYNQKGNELYYLSFDNSQPTLVKDSLLVPFFTDKKQFDITLYIPYPVAQEKRIPEHKRFIKSKTMYVQ